MKFSTSGIDATCRRKRKLEDLPYLLVNDTQKQEKENNTKDANNSSVQGELKLEMRTFHPKLLTFPDKVKERKEKQKRKKTIRLRLRSKSPVMPTTRVRTTSKDFWTAWHNME